MSAVLSQRALLSVARCVPRTASRRFESTAANAAKSVSQAAGSAAAKAKSVASSASESAQSASPSEMAAKTAAAAQDAAARASQGLSRVSSAAGPIIAQTAKGISQSLGKFGGPVGRAAGVIEQQTPVVIYYARVAVEMAKIVFQAQKMAPPSIETFRTYFRQWYQQVVNIWKSGAISETLLRSPQNLINVVKNLFGNLTTAKALGAGVVLAECVGFFSVGEILGRLKLVGYHGESPAAHH